MPEAFDSTYPEGSYQRGYREFLRLRSATQLPPATQSDAFYGGYKYATQHAMRTLEGEMNNDDNTQYTRDLLAALRIILRKGLI
jgi:hypothetical protein